MNVGGRAVRMVKRAYHLLGADRLLQKYSDLKTGHNVPVVKKNFSYVLKRIREKAAAIPCQEVVFKSDKPTESRQVLDRNEIWRTQTPHTFRLDKMLWANEEAARLGLETPHATCHLFSMLGETVYFSRGSEKNLKLTTVDDIDIFRALLRTEKSTWKR